MVKHISSDAFKLMLTIVTIMLRYCIKQFQDILDLVTKSCNIDIVMQKCGIMKEYQNIKIV